jgi:hypothetical protein
MKLIFLIILATNSMTLFSQKRFHIYGMEGQFLFETRDSNKMIDRITNEFWDLYYYIRQPLNNDTRIVMKIDVIDPYISILDKLSFNTSDIDSLSAEPRNEMNFPDGIWLNFERTKVGDTPSITTRYKIIDSIVEGDFYRYNHNEISGRTTYKKGFPIGWDYSKSASSLEITIYRDSSNLISSEIIIDFKKGLVIFKDEKLNKEYLFDDFAIQIGLESRSKELKLLEKKSFEK